MRISDWSSDVCSSDLCVRRHRRRCEQRGKQQGDAHAGKPALHCHSPAVGVVCHWMDTIFQLAPSFLRLSNSRLRSVVDLPLTVAWMSLSLPTMVVSPIDRKSTRLNSSH